VSNGSTTAFLERHLDGLVDVELVQRAVDDVGHQPDLRVLVEVHQRQRVGDSKAGEKLLI